MVPVETSHWIHQCQRPQIPILLRTNSIGLEAWEAEVFAWEEDLFDKELSTSLAVVDAVEGSATQLLLNRYLGLLDGGDKAVTNPTDPAPNQHQSCHLPRDKRNR